jgi:hypothetical protein
MTEQNWAERHWPEPRVTIRDQQTARALVPDVTGDPFEVRDAWFWRAANGSIVTVTKFPGSVHISAEPFGSLQDAAVSFADYWPAGLFAEDIGARDWMDHLDQKFGPRASSGYSPARTGAGLPSAEDD